MDMLSKEEIKLALSEASDIIERLRRIMDKHEVLDTNSPAYKTTIFLFDSAPIEILQCFAEANIRHLSSIAKEYLKRRIN